MEENPNACKNPLAVTNIPSCPKKTNIPSNSSSSHFINIAQLDHSKLSIMIPKLMAKTMHRRSRRIKRGYQFPKKVVSVFFSRVFGKKRSLGKKDEDHSDSESLLGRSDSHDGKKQHITTEGNDLVRGNERIRGPLFRLIKHELDNAVKPHDAEEGKHKSYNGEAARESTDVVSGWEVWRIKVRSWRLVRVVSRIVSITSWLKKKVRKEVEDEGEDEEACLCKKRILMGGRCKPLYSSGALQYDSDGILIPDLLL